MLDRRERPAGTCERDFPESGIHVLKSYRLTGLGIVGILQINSQNYPALSSVPSVAIFDPMSF